MIEKRIRIFLWGMSSTYFFAFSSLYLQNRELYSDDGLLPASRLLKGASNGWEKCEKLSLLCFMPMYGVSISRGVEILSLLGTILSLIQVIWPGMRKALIYVALWAIYFSLYQVGQTFLRFQWDILLLEAGFLTCLVSAVAEEPVADVMAWLVKWLAFRLMFASGVVKLTSQCPTWWGLTALNWHYESQCLPSPAAWFAHQLPEWFHRLSVVAVYVIEIGLPFFFFAPTRLLRNTAAYAQILLMVVIALTGNYNFFNFITCILCVIVLEDSILARDKRRASDMTRSVSLTFFSLATFLVLLIYTTEFFTLRIDTKQWKITSKIAFSKKEFAAVLAAVMPWTVFMATASLGVEILKATVRTFASGKNAAASVFSVLTCWVWCAGAVGMFAISLVPHASLDGGTRRYVPQMAIDYHAKLQPYQLTSSYGLFRRMTGVGGRPEIVLEGSDDPKFDKFQEFEFLFKPGNLSRAPTFVAPHQPRVDWQMWFAALDTYKHQPWLLHLVHKILSGDPVVNAFLERNPFEGRRPPKFLRIRRWTYHYTRGSAGPLGLPWRGPPSWWRRDSPREYMPAMGRDNPQLLGFLRDMKLLATQNKSSKDAVPALLTTLLDGVHLWSKMASPNIVILSTYVFALLLAR